MYKINKSKAGDRLTSLQLVCVLIIIVCGAIFFISNILGTRRYSDFLLRALKGPISYNDTELLNYIRNEILIPPSPTPYNLEGLDSLALLAVDDSEKFYENITRKLFKGRKHGFFIEAGALDGEAMSNTLALERKFNWTGLLVEADEVSFKKLLQKNRKAWSVGGCLAPNPYPSKELISSKSHYAGYGVLSAGVKVRAMHSLAKYVNGKMGPQLWYKPVHCFPLQSLLAALEVFHVDLLVLDVEGAEMDILKHLDFQRFVIDVIYMEWKYRTQHRKVADIMELRGYRLYAAFVEDLVFVRKGSQYDPGVSFVLPSKVEMMLSPIEKVKYKELQKRGITYVVQ